MPLRLVVMVWTGTAAVGVYAGEIEKMRAGELVVGWMYVVDWWRKGGDAGDTNGTGGGDDDERIYSSSLLEVVFSHRGGFLQIRDLTFSISALQYPISMAANSLNVGRIPSSLTSRLEFPEFL
ncbi:hypothetical protein C5167_041383 [Papaver somniferum]|nr:hypothetical protein C5167_041383 [Papaver somniferum]